MAPKNSDWPKLRIRAVELFERPVRFRKPFRFGAVTVEAAPQAFVRVLVDVEGRGEAWGCTAEMMMPKWFDKRPDRSPARTVDGLRVSLHLAARGYGGASWPDTAFGHHAAVRGAHEAACLAAGETRLTAAYGPALLDKAVLDGLLRALGVDFFSGMAGNVAGIDTHLTPDLDGFGLDGFLNGLRPLAAVCLRHTVGLVDDVEGLRALVTSGPHHFKIKLSGDPSADLDRLRAIAAVLDPVLTTYRATLDGNEQCPDTAALAAFLDGLEADPALAAFRRALLYVEQPIARERALDEPLGPVGTRHAVIIDESDESYDAFPRARAMGYRGVSSKSCKGLYKAVLNAARCAAWNGSGSRHFISAEDLTCQAGLAVQQDTALVALLGIGHAERNGHQYVDGFAGAPEEEAEAFLVAHPGFYTREDGRIRLNTGDGSLPAFPLCVPGFAHAAEPRWDSLQPLAPPAAASKESAS
ncbi:hypothetical protein [Azospirillum sp. TSO22-1]|uniref:hypothetical protein n=1 Tax=Azospirillum sp. TSO22-1 TaxID=716789 RepID=UPI000D60DE08|nr:hypothetical protein [Azospirillum sp. TSO22-1]PWC31838.1 hypothetical protein TSO221_32525 [Azospirillum sp. TSO22-1]